jgi:hypothetical protein
MTRRWAVVTDQVSTKPWARGPNRSKKNKRNWSGEILFFRFSMMYSK